MQIEMIESTETTVIYTHITRTAKSKIISPLDNLDLKESDKNDKKNKTSKCDIHDKLSYTTSNPVVFATKCRGFIHYAQIIKGKNEKLY